MTSSQPAFLAFNGADWRLKPCWCKSLSQTACARSPLSRMAVDWNHGLCAWRNWGPEEQSPANFYWFPPIYRVCHPRTQTHSTYRNTSLGHTDHFLRPLSQIKSPEHSNSRQKCLRWSVKCLLIVTCGLVLQFLYWLHFCLLSQTSPSNLQPWHSSNGNLHDYSAFALMNLNLCWFASLSICWSSLGCYKTCVDEATFRTRIADVENPCLGRLSVSALKRMQRPQWKSCPCPT